jgi:hypothetical protein
MTAIEHAPQTSQVSAEAANSSLLFPTLTIWAVVLRAAEKLARDLGGRCV